MSRMLQQKDAELRQLIQQLAGQQLPGERELAERLQISRPRIRAMLALLESEGLVERRPGSGTYAVDTQAGQLNSVTLLIDENLKLGNDPFFSLLLEHLQNTLQRESISCVIERISGQQRPRNVKDGAITIGQAGKAILERLRADDLPVVGLLLDAVPHPHIHASVFQLADRQAGQQAAQRLLAIQCQELFFVGRRDIAASHERLIGAEEVAAQAGVPLSFLNCSLNYMAGLRLGRELELPGDERGAVGIIATNDWLAIGLHAGLAGQKVASSQALHIVSFDGLPVTAEADLGIESLAIPIEAIASDAVAELHRLRRSKVAVGRVVQYQLAWRLKQQEEIE